MDENNSQECSFSLVFQPTDVYTPLYLSIYVPASIVGLLGNIILLFLHLVHRPTGSTERATSRFLLKALAVNDICLCFLCVISCSLGPSVLTEQSIVRLLLWSISYNFVGTEFVILSLISTDRAMAVIWPTSSYWSIKIARIIFIGLSSSLTFWNIVSTYLEINPSSCVVRSTASTVYKMATAVFTLILTTGIIVSYVSLFSYFADRLRRQSRVIGSTISTSSGREGASATSDNSIRALLPTIKMGKSLLLITLVFIASVIPFFESNVSGVPISQSLYDIFYFNCVCNPYILWITSSQLRNELKNLLKRSFRECKFPY
jgi:hypothetical protein